MEQTKALDTQTDHRTWPDGEPSTNGLTYLVQQVSVKLALTPEVFAPSVTSLLVAQNLVVHTGETVCDVGCGTGLLSILASRMGAARVFGTDVNPAAVALAQENARRNAVTNCRFAIGTFFGSDDGQYDVIAANLPQTPVPAALPEMEWRLDGYGGSDGADTVCRYLELASARLARGGRVYVPIIGYANPARTTAMIKKLYAARTIAEQEMQLPFYLLARLTHLLKLRDLGRCEIYQRRNHMWYCKETLLELRAA